MFSSQVLFAPYASTGERSRRFSQTCVLGKYGGEVEGRFSVTSNQPGRFLSPNRATKRIAVKQIQGCRRWILRQKPGMT